MKGLEDLNLIYRLQLDLNSESHTFLQPYIFRSDNRVEKYTYSFRINNLDIRDKLLLIFFEDKISNLTKKYFKNKVYLLVDEKEITITSYTPINNSIRNYAKFLNENLKEIIDLYIETNIETNNKDWSFESYKKKKKAVDLIASRKM